MAQTNLDKIRKYLPGSSRPNNKEAQTSLDKTRELSNLDKIRELSRYFSGTLQLNNGDILTNYVQNYVGNKKEIEKLRAKFLADAEQFVNNSEITDILRTMKKDDIKLLLSGKRLPELRFLQNLAEMDTLGLNIGSLIEEIGVNDDWDKFMNSNGNKLLEFIKKNKNKIDINLLVTNMHIDDFNNEFLDNLQSLLEDFPNYNYSEYIKNSRKNNEYFMMDDIKMIRDEYNLESKDDPESKEKKPREKKPGAKELGTSLTLLAPDEKDFFNKTGVKLRAVWSYHTNKFNFTPEERRELNQKTKNNKEYRQAIREEQPVIYKSFLESGSLDKLEKLKKKYGTGLMEELLLNKTTLPETELIFKLDELTEQQPNTDLIEIVRNNGSSSQPTIYEIDNYINGYDIPPQREDKNDDAKEVKIRDIDPNDLGEEILDDVEDDDDDYLYNPTKSHKSLGSVGSKASTFLQNSKEFLDLDKQKINSSNEAKKLLDSYGDILNKQFIKGDITKTEYDELIQKYNEKKGAIPAQYITSDYTLKEVPEEKKILKIAYQRN